MSAVTVPLPDLTPFPSTFRWGAATAAYQTEGGVDEGGRIPSMWDTYCHTPGRIAHGATADIANDSYHRLDDDLALIKSLGLQAYRFSIAWPRITDTAGRPNQAGLDYYARLVDGLLALGVEPIATLYHWDLPQYLEDAGGWTNRDTAFRMADYAAVVAGALGDRIGTWTTLNEPWCIAHGGYMVGIGAPGRTEVVAGLQAAHHLNLAHGATAAVLRSVLPAQAQVSLTLNLHRFRPNTDSEQDLEAVRCADAVANRIFLNPILDGHYPDDLLTDTAAVTDWSWIRDEDLPVIHARPDVLGLNYYTHAVLSGDPALVELARDPATGYGLWPGTQAVCALPAAEPKTDMGWTVDPQEFTAQLVDLHTTYPDLPLMITENGAAYDDELVDGAVDDLQRVQYLSRHIEAVGRAITQGADIRGYLAWSLMDVFEWSWGYDIALGLVYVDRETQDRVIKRSGYWYRDLISAFAAQIEGQTI